MIPGVSSRRPQTGVNDINYQQALDYLDNSISRGTKSDLDGIRHILKCCGDPQKRMNFVHITGTNGKGSTASFLASILTRAGHGVGLFTSPHLSDFRERIQSRGKLIKKSGMCAILRKIKAITDEMKVMPSYFEVMTALAILYFESEKCDISIMEVGLGGRLDSTNVIDGKICVITGIDMDHMEYLGNTLEDIAREKTGIVKPGSIMIVNTPDKNLYRFIETQARTRGAAETAWVPDIVRGRIISSKVGGTTFETCSDTMKEFRAKIPLVGDYQFQNAATAIAVIEKMKKHGMTRATPDEIRKGFESTFWPGRFEIFGRKRQLVMDGAHNIQGMRCFTRNLRQLFAGRRIRSIVGILTSKDFQHMLDAVAEVSDEMMICGLANSPKNKNIDVSALFSYASSIHGNVKSFPTIIRALEYAKKTLEPEDVVCVTGSLYLVGEARDFVLDKRV